MHVYLCQKIYKIIYFIYMCIYTHIYQGYNHEEIDIQMLLSLMSHRGEIWLVCFMYFGLIFNKSSHR